MARLKIKTGHLLLLGGGAWFLWSNYKQASAGILGNFPQQVASALGSIGLSSQQVATQVTSAFALGPRGTGSQVLQTTGPITQAVTAGGPTTFSSYLPPSGGTAPGAVAPGTTFGQSPLLNAISAANPNFTQLATQFRMNQCAAGFSPDDWNALRSYLAATGAPDAGNIPPPEWPTQFGGALSCTQSVLLSPL